MCQNLDFGCALDLDFSLGFADFGAVLGLAVLPPPLANRRSLISLPEPVIVLDFVFNGKTPTLVPGSGFAILLMRVKGVSAVISSI